MSQSSKRSLFGMLLVLGVVIGGIAAWVAYRGPSGKGGSGAGLLTPEDYAEVMARKLSANGHLENFPRDDIETTSAEFAALGVRFPDERLPKRNEAIARILALNVEYEVGDPQREAKTTANRQNAQQACADLLGFEKESPESIWLWVAFLLHENNGIAPSAQRDERIVTALKDAMKRAPTNPIYPYAIFNTAVNTTSNDLRERELLPAIRKTYEIAPQNAAVVRHLLVALADAKAPEMGEVLERSRDLILSLRKQVLREGGGDIQPHFDSMVEGVETEDWRKTIIAARRFNNLVIPLEVVKRDESLLNPHVLEFMDHDFSDGVACEGKTRSPLSEVAVSWTALEAAIPSMESAVDVRMCDFTLDGGMELVILEPGRLRVLAPQDGAFRELVSVETLANPRGMAIADIDSDYVAKVDVAGEAGGCQEPADHEGDDAESPGCYKADVDVVVYGEDGIQFWRNVKGDGPSERSLTLVAQEEQDLAGLRDIVAATLVDIDHDADLDLAVVAASGVSIWASRGKETMQFFRLDEWSTLPPADIDFTAIRAVDWDRDVDIDLLLVAGDGKTRGLLTNMRHARFVWTPLDDSWNALADAVSIVPLEADGNVSWDAAVAGKNGVRVVLTTTALRGTTRFHKESSVDQMAATGVAALDYDNDGAVDLASWGEGGVRISRGLGDGSFAPAQSLTEAPARSVSAADWDADGDLDLAVVEASGVRILQNNGGNKNHWVAIRARGREDNRGRANQSGVGSLIELRSGGRYQAQVVDSQVSHFGIGEAEKAEIARIVWTNGVPQNLVEPQADSMICEWMVLKGSCPYLYTWNGEQFVFQTDCLWAAPVGLQVADGVLAPSRPWEYLKIPGEDLKARDGYYTIQLTEELWEIAYFDKVELIAVDHPEDVEIYSNEKVGPPSIAEYKVHTVGQPRILTTAFDSMGRDVRETLLEADDDFVKAFDSRIYQGLTPPHFIELDLGELESPEQIKLFLRGWIRPTDTSLNIAFSQNPILDGPKFPSIWVPDGNGEWREARPYMGFPGGKTKTIVVDLSDVFLSSDYRVRIQTTAEIYWDQAFFTVDEEPAPVATTRMPVANADLHYRGFSRRYQRPNHAPSGYDYDDVERRASWPPIRGKFTRYGDVAELLTVEDDQSAILGSGDEITVRFRVPSEPLKPGWKRDFLLHCVGWDKDADLNVIHSQTVEPLPFRAMTHYPYDPETFPRSKSFDAYLETYQTREQSPADFWRQLQRDARN